MKSCIEFHWTGLSGVCRRVNDSAVCRCFCLHLDELCINLHRNFLKRKNENEIFWKDFMFAIHLFHAWNVCKTSFNLWKVSAIFRSAKSVCKLWFCANFHSAKSVCMINTINLGKSRVGWGVSPHYNTHTSPFLSHSKRTSNAARNLKI